MFQVVGADALTRWVDWEDRNTCVLFGDGAGAMVLTATDSVEEAGLLGFEMHRCVEVSDLMLPRLHNIEGFLNLSNSNSKGSGFKGILNSHK